MHFLRVENKMGLTWCSTGFHGATLRMKGHINFKVYSISRVHPSSKPSQPNVEAVE